MEIKPGQRYKNRIGVFEVLTILKPGEYEIITLQKLCSDCRDGSFTVSDHSFIDDLKYLEGQDKPA